jgi:hypothetical protein
MASHNAVLKSESKSKLRQVSNSAQTQHFSSLELLLDSYMPEIALSSKSADARQMINDRVCGGGTYSIIV